MNRLYYEDIVKVAELPYEWERLKNSNVLILGAYSMIGRALIDVLVYRNRKFSMSCKITAFGRNESKLNKYLKQYIEKNEIEVLVGDVNEDIDFCENSFDYYIYTVGSTHPLEYSRYPVDTIETNILGLNNVLKGMKNKRGRLIYLSSVEIYGTPRDGYTEFDEKYSGYIDCNTLRAGYPESKRAGEALCQAYISQYQYDIIIVRVARAFGYTMHMDDSKALSQFIKNGINGEDIILKSSGQQRFSYIYVMDVVSGIIKILLDGKSGEAYNLSGDEKNIRLIDLAETIAEYTGKKVQAKVLQPDRP